MDYAVFNSTVRGASHKRKDIPCEDYSLTLSSNEPSYRVAVVADGHGDPTCVRSSVGSRLAAEIAARSLGEYAVASMTDAEAKGIGMADLLCSNEGEVALTRLSDAIVYEWSRAAREDLEASPLTQEEMENLGQVDEAWALEHVEHLYGSTLVAAVLVPGALVLVQVGDGCCAVVYEDGEIADPVPVDEQCVGNVTTSLSDPNASGEVRHAVVDLRERKLVACYVATDGVEKSLPDDGGVLDYFGKLTVELPEHVEAEDVQEYLDATLEELNDLGSGDDTSVAAMIDLSAVDAVAKELARRHETFSVLSRLQWGRRKLVSMQRKRDHLLEQPPTEGGVGERERYLAEYDELTMYVSDLEKEAAKLLGVDAVPFDGEAEVGDEGAPAEVEDAAGEAEAMAAPAEEAVVEEEGEVDKTASFDVPGQTAAFDIVTEGPQSLTARVREQSRAGVRGRNAGRFPKWGLLAAILIALVAIILGVVLLHMRDRARDAQREQAAIENAASPSDARPSEDRGASGGTTEQQGIDGTTQEQTTEPIYNDTFRENPFGDDGVSYAPAEEPSAEGEVAQGETTDGGNTEEGYTEEEYTEEEYTEDGYTNYE